VQIPPQLFDLRAACRENNELFLVPWNKTLNILIISCLVSIVKHNNNNNNNNNNNKKRSKNNKSLPTLLLGET
jgi:hypothetical protein